MAIPSYSTATITGTDSFQNWIDETNNILADLATKVVTLEPDPTGGSTTGNGAIVGIFSANTLVAGTALRGGTIGTPAPLAVSSNAAFSGTASFAGSTTFNGSAMAINSTTITISSASSLTSSGNVTLDGTTKALNVDMLTVAVSSNNFTVSSNNMTITVPAVSFSGNVSVTGTITGSITGNAGSVTDGVYITGDQTIAGVKTFSSTIIGSVDGNAGTVTNGVYTTGNQTIAGTKTFSSTIAGSITGNANTVTNGVYTNSTSVISGAKTFTDSTQLNFGSDVDTKLYHNGSNMFMEVITGSYYIRDAALSNLFTFNITNGNFTASGNVTAYSDARLKSNVRTIDSALSKVSAMRGVYFDKDGVASTGVIAQEIEQILPEVVLDGEYKSVAYGNIVGVLIEAIKELKLEIELLKGI